MTTTKFEYDAFVARNLRLNLLREAEHMVLDDASLIEHVYRLTDPLEDDERDAFHAALQEVFERWSTNAVLEHCRRQVQELDDPEAELEATRTSVERRQELRVRLLGRGELRLEVSAEGDDA